MTHLSNDELVDLVEDVLPPTRRAHLETCDTCRERSAALEAVLEEALEADIVPEPSPLFWEHLSARVRDAVAEPAPATWRDRVWWPAGAWAAGLTAVALAVAVSSSVLPRPQLAALPTVVISAPTVAETVVASADQPVDDIEADEAWALVRSVADQIEWDDAHEVGIATRPDAAERMTLELSMREQSELARLLHHELQRSGT